MACGVDCTIESLSLRCLTELYWMKGSIELAWIGMMGVLEELWVHYVPD